MFTLSYAEVIPRIKVTMFTLSYAEEIPRIVETK